MALQSIKLAVFTLFISKLSFGNTAPSPRIRDAVSIDIHSQGFDTISKIIFESSLKRPKVTKLESYSFSIPFLTKVKFTGIELTPKFETFHLNPENSLIEAQLSLDNLEVNINKVEFTPYFLPPVMTQCSSFSVKIENLKQFPIIAKLKNIVEDGEVKLLIEEFKADLSSTNLELKPNDNICQNVSAQSRYYQLFINLLTKYARSFLLKALEAKLEKEMTKLVFKLENIINLQISLKTSDFVMVPSASLTLRFHPTNINLSEEKLSLLLDLDITNNETSRNNFTEDPILSELKKFATLSINQHAFNSIIKNIMSNGSVPFELSPSLHEYFAKILSVSELEYFFPDLATAPTDVDYLKAVLTLSKDPEISVNSSENHINLLIPKLDVRLMIKQNGVWRDYFKIMIKFSIDSILEAQSGEFTSCFSPPNMSIQGEWAKNYTPTNDTFNSEFLNDLMQQLIEVAVSDCPISHQMRPLRIGSKKILPDHIRVDAPFIKFDVVSLENLK